MTENGSPDGRNFWKGHYGKEPFDLRLTVLRMLIKLPVIVLVTFLGVLVFGGGYYVKNVLLRGQQLFAATSVYRVEYNVDSEAELQTSYINAMTWNTYLQSQVFLDMLQSRLAGKTELTFAELEESMEAFVWSDLRAPAITVTTDEAAKTETILRAVDEVMTQDFTLREINSVSVIDPGLSEEVIPDVRVGRAVALSAVLSCFFAVIILLLKETGDDSIWLPGTIWKRYGVKAAGTLESRGFAENIRYFFGEDCREDSCQKAEAGDGSARREKEQKAEAGDGSARREKEQKAEAGEGAVQREKEQEAEAGEGVVRREKEQEAGARETALQGKGRKGAAWESGIAVCMVQEELEPEAVLARLKEKCPETVDDSWFAVASPLTKPESCAALRQADGILLAVKAGCHAGKALEYVLEYLQQQNCEVTAAILWEADEKLIRRYYFLCSKS